MKKYEIKLLGYNNVSTHIKFVTNYTPKIIEIKYNAVLHTNIKPVNYQFSLSIKHPKQNNTFGIIVLNFKDYLNNVYMIPSSISK